MTWAQLRQLYLQAAGNDTSAQEEAYTHLSEGHRDIGLLIDLPEVNSKEQITVPAGQDFVMVEALTPMFAILDGVNITNGIPIYPEKGGMTGRRRYVQTTGRVSDGPITNYQRDGNRIWVRGAPTVPETLEFRLQRQLDDIGDNSLNDSPIVPAQYHMAIVYAAAEKYFLLHPKIDMVGEVPVVLSEKYKTAKIEAVASRKVAVVEEDRPRQEHMRLSGYRVMPRSRGAR